MDTQNNASKTYETDGTACSTSNDLQNPGEVAQNNALQLLMQDPVGFVQSIVAQSNAQSLADMKEEAELRSALTQFRKQFPEYSRFEPFILQGVADLLQNDAEVAADSWEMLLEKAANQLASTFQALLQEKQNNTPPDSNYVEGQQNRQPAALPATFSREQIARMSLPDFIQHEAAINEALKNNRIRS